MLLLWDMHTNLKTESVFFMEVSFLIIVLIDLVGPTGSTLGTEASRVNPDLTRIYTVTWE